METVLELELGNKPTDECKTYATLFLPTTPYELRDALDELRLPKDGVMTVEILSAIPEASYLMDRMKWQSRKAPELYLVNALTEKIAQMDSMARCVLEGMVRMEREKEESGIPAARLYDLASSMDRYNVVPEATDDASLGRYYVKNGFLAEYDDLPEPVTANLDYAKIGREMREEEDGVFLSRGGYVVQHDEIREASREFAPQEPDYTVLMEVSQGAQTALLKLPAAPHEMDAALAAVGAVDWPDVRLRCVDCKVPVLEETMTKSADVAQASRAARMLEGLDREQTTVYKALLEARGITNLEGALEMIVWLDQYILKPEYDTPADVGLSYLQNLVGPDEAEQMRPYVHLYDFGNSVMQRRHISMTHYGTIERRDGEPVREVFDQQPEESRDTGNDQAKHDRKPPVPSR